MNEILGILVPYTFLLALILWIVVDNIKRELQDMHEYNELRRLWFVKEIKRLQEKLHKAGLWVDP